MEKNVFEAIRAGEFENKLPYGTRTKSGINDDERVAFHKEDNRLEEEFKTRALKQFGLFGHPKAEKAFAMAWDRGHSAGFNSVAIELSELAEILL